MRSLRACVRLKFVIRVSQAAMQDGRRYARYMSEIQS